MSSFIASTTSTSNSITSPGTTTSGTVHVVVSPARTHESSTSSIAGLSPAACWKSISNRNESPNGTASTPASRLCFIPSVLSEKRVGPGRDDTPPAPYTTFAITNEPCTTSTSGATCHPDDDARLHFGSEAIVPGSHAPLPRSTHVFCTHPFDASTFRHGTAIGSNCMCMCDPMSSACSTTTSLPSSAKPVTASIGFPYIQRAARSGRPDAARRRSGASDVQPSFASSASACSYMLASSGGTTHVSGFTEHGGLICANASTFTARRTKYSGGISPITPIALPLYPADSTNCHGLCPHTGVCGGSGAV